MARISSYLQIIRVGWVFAREGVISALPSDDLPPAVKMLQKTAGLVARRNLEGRRERFAKAIARLGPSYVKMGQFLATRPDVIGAEFAFDLSGLQDEMETFPTEQAIMQINSSIGRPVDELFESFEAPIAAASIAQVHPATVKTENGIKKVAVKVIRPGIRRKFERDLATFFHIAQLQERFIPSSHRLRPVEVAKVLEQTTRIEMDLRLEAAAISELGENSKNDPGFSLPQVDWERTGRDVITMEWVDGTKISDIAGLKKAGHDLNKLADTLIQSFLRHTLRDGFFHADMHQGNLFVGANGDIIAVDLGIVGRLGKKERRFLAEILFGFITRNYKRVAQVHFDAGYVPRHHDVMSFAQAIRAIGEPIHGQSSRTISMAKMLTLLFEITELFDMETRPELVNLQKTMVVVEGVSRTLNPDFNMWEASEEVVGGWIRQNLGPARIAETAKDGMQAALHLAEIAPEMALRAEELSQNMLEMSKNGMRFDAQTADAIGKAEAKHSRSGRIALWVIALTAVYYVFL